MVGDAVLREVIRADALGAIHGADLTLAINRSLSIGFLLIPRENAGSKHAHSGFPVLQLRFFVLHRYDDPGRKMGDAHGGVGGVNRLPAGPTRAVDVDLQIILTDLDLFGFIDLGEDEHAGRRGVDAALRLSRGNALHPVHATLVLEVCPDAFCGIARVALECNLHIFDATQIAGGLLNDFGFPLLRLCIVQVHAKQIASKERRFCATLAHLDLHDDITRVVGVTRDQEPAKFLLRRIE